jgi:hypothetical protein
LFQGVLSNAAANGKRLRAMAALTAQKPGIFTVIPGREPTAGQSAALWLSNPESRETHGLPDSGSTRRRESRNDGILDARIG